MWKDRIAEPLFRVLNNRGLVRGVFDVALSFDCQHTFPVFLVRDKCDTRIIFIPRKIFGESSKLK